MFLLPKGTMETSRAVRILTEHLHYGESDAIRAIAVTNLRLAGEQGKSIIDFPESWLLHLLNMAGQLSDQERQHWIRHDLSPNETPQELDAMLTQAFCDPDSLRVLRSPHEEDSGPHQR